jgi:hypothetical protein
VELKVIALVFRKYFTHGEREREREREKECACGFTQINEHDCSSCLSCLFVLFYSSRAYV